MSEHEEQLKPGRDFHKVNDISLRDYFAGQALAAYISADPEWTNDDGDCFKACAKIGYKYADAMIAERSK